MPNEENEEKHHGLLPISPKALKTKLRKSVRRQQPRDMQEYDSGREASNEGDKVKAEEEEEEATTEAEEEKSHECHP